MPIRATKEEAVPPGQHEGVIIDASETTKTFDPNKGPEEVVELIIEPDYEPDSGARVLTLNVLFSPVINGLSALSRCLERLQAHPDEGASWEPASLIGTRVQFTAEENGDFMRVDKDSLRVAASGAENDE